jgi:hypothetical protein
MTGKDWDPYSEHQHRLGDSPLEWAVRNALALPELTLEGAFAKLRNLPEEVLLNHYQFRPTTPAEIEYLSLLSVE